MSLASRIDALEREARSVSMEDLPRYICAYVNGGPGNPPGPLPDEPRLRERVLELGTLTREYCRLLEMSIPACAPERAGADEARQFYVLQSRAFDAQAEAYQKRGTKTFGPETFAYAEELRSALEEYRLKLEASIRGRESVPPTEPAA